ncbi:MAG TPA: hypothetical protein VF761_10615 [Gemmatimonadaceae bacterium]
MHRRHFLQLASVTTLGALASGCRAAREYDALTLTHPELLKALGAERVRTIGERYRATTRGESDAESLRQAIDHSRPAASRILGAAGPSVADLVREDFEKGRTVVVDGWVLSRTEARQCALYSITRPA